MLHKWKDFARTEEYDKAFEELKKYLAHPLILSRLKKKEVLYVYVAIKAHVVSLVMIRMEEGVQNQSIT